MSVFETVNKRAGRQWLAMEQQMRVMRRVRRRVNRYRADGFLVSFPKSGRTWLRYVLGHALKAHYRLPADQDVIFSRDLMERLTGQTVRVTHNFTARDDIGYSGTDKRPFQGKVVVLLGRDIRDTLVSYYYHKTKRNGDCDGMSVSDFVRDPRYGALKIVQFYKSWADNVHLPEAFTFIRYEEMLTEMPEIVRETLDLYGVAGVSDRVIQQAVMAGDINRMRKVEQSGQHSFSGLRPRGDTADPNAFKVRRGGAGGWMDELSWDDAAYIDDVVRQVGVDPFWVYHPLAEPEPVAAGV